MTATELALIIVSVIGGGYALYWLLSKFGNLGQ